MNTHLPINGCIVKMRCSLKVIVQYLDTLGRRYVVKFGTLNFASGNELSPGISTLSISGNFEGAYVNLVKFLEAIEQSRRRIVVKTINVEVLDIQKSSFYLKMEAYYQKPVTDIAS